MIACLLTFLGAVLVLLVVVLVVEAGFSAFGAPLTPQISYILRLIAALVCLLVLLQCFAGGGAVFPFRPCP